MSLRPAPPSAPTGSAPRFTALLYFASRAALPIAVAAYAWFYQGEWKEHWPAAAIVTGCLLILFQWSARMTARPRCPVCREGVLRRTAKLHPHARKWLGISASAPAAWEILTSDSHQCMHCHSRCRNQRTGLAINTPPPALALSPWDPRSGSSVFDPAPATPRATLLPLGALFQDSPPVGPTAGPISRQTMSEEWELPPSAPTATSKWAGSAFWEKAGTPVPPTAPAPVAPDPVSIPEGPNPFLSRIPERAKPESDSPFSLLQPATPAPEPEPVAATPHVRSPFTAVRPASPAPPQSLTPTFPSLSPPPTPRANSMESNDFPFPAMPVTPPLTPPAAAPIADLPAGDPPIPPTSAAKIPFPTAAPRAPAAAEPTAEMLRGLLEIMRDGRRALDGAFDQMLARLERVLEDTPAAAPAPAPAAEAWSSPSPAFPAPAAEAPAPEWTAPPKPLDFTSPAAVGAPLQPPPAFPLPEGKTAPFPAPSEPLLSGNVANETASPLPPITASEPVDFPLPPLIPLSPPASPPPRPVAAPAAPANWFPISSAASPAAAETPVDPLVPEPRVAARPDTAPLPLPFPPALPEEDDWNPPVAAAPAAPAIPSPLSPLPPFGAPADPAPAPSPRLRRLPALDPLTAQELSHTLANAFTSRPPSASPTARPAGESPFEFLGGSFPDDTWPELPDSPWNHPRSGHTPPQS